MLIAGWRIWNRTEANIQNLMSFALNGRVTLLRNIDILDIIFCDNKVKILVFIKLFLRNFFLLNSFCKECGRKVHDFYVSDDIWELVKPHIKYGKVLCYDCFCDKCKEVGLPTCWFLYNGL